MTDAQKEIFERISDLLKEHFEAAVVAVVDEADGGRITTMLYHGGLMQAIGIARACEAKMVQHSNNNIAFRSNDEQEQEEPEC